MLSIVEIGLVIEDFFLFPRWLGIAVTIDKNGKFKMGISSISDQRSGYGMKSRYIPTDSVFRIILLILKKDWF